MTPTDQQRGVDAETQPAQTGRRLPFVAFLVAEAVSVAGNRIAMMAIPWFVLETSGSAALTGVTAFVFFVPSVLAAVLGGAIVDRFGYRQVSVVSDIANMLAVAAVPTMYAIGVLGFPLLVLLVFLGTLFDAPGNTARRAMLPDLATSARLPIERAAALHDGAYRLAQLVGPGRRHPHHRHRHDERSDRGRGELRHVRCPHRSLHRGCALVSASSAGHDAQAVRRRPPRGAHLHQA
ncbi:MFS transporter [Salinispora mooreana]|uniref:MFS transporter n=1 Tax=Salinispora mooreana TaxID=999545 RepID=UPI00039F4725|nr:MFS transporter [Salinispora mooreana]